ncbi:glycine betaine ABC transporter substrate-binding protein [Streptosporangium sp. NBC_01639]|uniref:glycine betaine ABC transporter substrate-binding protein n=1 Tax=unclassified Streptosporangium TaxID=2632669 RepID=UPI002DDA8B90|nr:glycine betaine ABC transporter substrate-binding protein [Streptosporangium sp. NBC_01756]WSC85562.1 glycine betaine ABC transporter substrate-binding protein [Streptosporangium sp. NBC_01756]WTD55765.1 glycine betaine ABC transporter substrate-binding protein [Streptosporangium sp. NBC_01639]
MGARTLRHTLALLAAATLTAATVSGCGAADAVEASSAGDELAGAEFVIGSKDFTENIMLGQIAVHLLKAHGAEVVDKTNLGGTAPNRKALESGSIDMYWDYSGTGWIEHLKNATPIQDSAEQFKATAAADLEKNKIQWIGPTPLNNTYALAIRSEKAKELGVKTISDVVELSRSKPEEVTVCIETEFSTRDDGLPGLSKAYGMTIPKDRISLLDTGVVYTETDKGQTCNFGEVFTTDGRIAALGLTVLQDDKRFFPSYNAAVTLRQETYQKYPALEKVLQPVIDKLDDATMQKLNARVDVDGEEPGKVSADWLDKSGFLGGGA